MEENNLFEPVDTGLQSAVALDDNAYGFDSNEGIETATALSNDAAYLDFTPEVGESPDLASSVVDSQIVTDDLTGATEVVALEQGANQPEALDSFTFGFGDINFTPYDPDGFPDYADRIIDLFDPDDFGFTPFGDDVEGSFIGIGNNGSLVFEVLDDNGDVRIVESDFDANDFDFIDDPQNVQVLPYNFDFDFYTEVNPNINFDGVDPFTHFMTEGWQQGLDPSPFFDTSYYEDEYSSILDAEDNPYKNPLEHYNFVGWTMGLDPSPFFDTSWYQENNSDVFDDGTNPLEHFLSTGYTIAEQRDPSPFFDNSFYRETYNLDPELNPLEYYIAEGWQLGQDPSPYFDSSEYLDNYPEVLEAQVNPLEDFLTGGWELGRNPSAFFDVNYYNATYTDVADSGMNPLEHYIRDGQVLTNGRLRNPSALFDTEFYYNRYNDVANSNLGALEHFQISGATENRIGSEAFESEDVVLLKEQVISPEALAEINEILEFNNIELENFNIELEGFTYDGIPPEIQNIIERETETLVAGPIGIAIKLGLEYIKRNPGQVGRGVYLFTKWGGRILSVQRGYEFVIDRVEEFNQIYVYPGQEEPKIELEVFPGANYREIAEGDNIFTTPFNEPGIFDNIEVFPGPEGNALDQLIDGVFTFPDETEPSGPYILNINQNGNPIGYNPFIVGNISTSQWNNKINERGSVDLDFDVLLPYRIPNSVRDQQGLSKERTHGIFLDVNNNTEVKLVSGTRNMTQSSRIFLEQIDQLNLAPRDKNATIISLGHAEGNAAAIMRRYGINEGRIFINHNEGPCDFCQGVLKPQEDGTVARVEIGLEHILLPGQSLEVIWTEDGGVTIERKTFTGK